MNAVVMVRLGSEHRDHRQRQDDDRERHEHVEHALENEVGPAAEIRARHPEDQPDGSAGER